jgi:hypothetical protein
MDPTAAPAQGSQELAPGRRDRIGMDMDVEQDGVSANLLYGFEQFILQSVQSGHVKVTFSREGHLFASALCVQRLIQIVHDGKHISTGPGVTGAPRWVETN